MKKNVLWKGAFRSIPTSIKTKLAQIRSDLVKVAATKKIPLHDVASRCYVHLGITSEGSTLKIVAESVLPPAKFGKFADRNRNGWEVKRTDLPKIIKSFSWETPNFGDAFTYGTHTHYRDRQVYQLEVFEPRLFPIKIELLNSPEAEAALIKFEVGQLLNKRSAGFETDLLFCLNLLQESTGVSGVYASEATREDFIGTVHLDWEVFPPGKADELIAFIKKNSGGLSPQKAGVVAERIKLFGTLPVKQFIYGSGSFGGAGAYVGALYADDLVVFENMTYGNALYVLYDDWQDVSKRSRLELLRGTTENFDRVVHTDGWEQRFQELIQKRLNIRRPRKRY
jgi:hypothetical protein